MTTLESAAASATRVTVTRKDGRSYVGVPVASWEPHTYALRTGKRGRPPKVHVDDVETVEVAAD